MLPAGIKRHRFTVQEYHSMADTGLLSEDDPVEFVDGEIVDMTPVGTRHLACVVTLTHLLIEASGGRYFVSVRNPILLDEGNRAAAGPESVEDEAESHGRLAKT